MSLRFTYHGVLAGAYTNGRGRKAPRDDQTCLVHVSADGGENALCGKVKPGNLCDVHEPEPTCETCKRYQHILVHVASVGSTPEGWAFATGTLRGMARRGLLVVRDGYPPRYVLPLPGGLKP